MVIDRLPEIERIVLRDLFDIDAIGVLFRAIADEAAFAAAMEIDRRVEQAPGVGGFPGGG